MNEFDTSPLLDLALLDRYLANETAPAERARVEAWLAANPVHVQRLQTLQMLGDTHGIADAETLNVDRAWARVAHAREAFVRKRMRSHEGNGKRFGGTWILPRGGFFKAQTLRRGVWYSLTAAIVVTTITLGWHAGLLHRAIYIDGPVSTYVTGNGERANITLPDGNTVTLNVASHLEVPADYLAGEHTVRLRGEALFNVIQHAHTPFSVVAGQTTTQVLGTSFLVRHYATDSVTTVAVREGKVRVGAAVVTANRFVEVHGSGPIVSRVAAPSCFSFATGTLALDQLTLPEAVTELDRWYDADIRLADPAMASRYVMSGKFAVGSLSDLMVYLELILDVRVVRHGRVLTLYPK